MVKKVSFGAYAWSRANAEGLSVSGDLLGRSHEFAFGDCDLTVTIPSVRLDSELRPIDRDSELASLSSWRSDGATLETSTYLVWEVELRAEVPGRFELPTVMFEHSPNRPDLAGSDASEKLDATMLEYQLQLAAGFQHWQRMARWISSSHYLGATQIQPHSERLSFARLRRKTDGKSFWIAGGYSAGAPTTHLTEELWGAIELALHASEAGPLWFHYLDQAYQNAGTRDLVGVVLSCAIAIETLAREALWFKTGGNASEDVRDLVDRVPVRSILGRWHKLTGIPKSRLPLSILNDLFDLRNKLMHAGGRGTTIDDRSARELFSATRTFVLIGDQWFYEARGVPNPRNVDLARDRAFWPSTGRAEH